HDFALRRPVVSWIVAEFGGRFQRHARGIRPVRRGRTGPRISSFAKPAAGRQSSSHALVSPGPSPARHGVPRRCAAFSRLVGGAGPPFLPETAVRLPPGDTGGGLGDRGADAPPGR